MQVLFVHQNFPAQPVGHAMRAESVRIEPSARKGVPTPATTPCTH